MRRKSAPHLFMRALLVLLCSCSTRTHLSAQTSCASVARPRTSVTADLSTQQWTGTLPFDEEFTLRVAIPKLAGAAAGKVLTAVELVYGPARAESRTDAFGVVTREIQMGERAGRDSVPLDGAIEQKEVVLTAGPLDPGKTYLFDFRLYAGGDTVDTIRMAGGAFPDVTSRFNTELGVVRGARSRYTGLTTTVHFYVVPVNENECTLHYRGADHLLKRASVFAGLSVVELYSGADVDHLYAAGSPVVGIGLARLPYLGPLRINTGIVFLKQDDANPLVDTRRNKRDLFVSGSLDFELQKVLAPVIGLLGVK